MEQPKSATYFQASRTGTYGFLAALPLFLLYEVLILFVNGDEISQIRVGADLWIKSCSKLIQHAIGVIQTDIMQILSCQPDTNLPGTGADFQQARSRMDFTDLQQPAGYYTGTGIAQSGPGIKVRCLTIKGKRY